jgi:hypothetical protein
MFGFNTFQFLFTTLPSSVNSSLLLAALAAVKAEVNKFDIIFLCNIKRRLEHTD